MSIKSNLLVRTILCVTGIPAIVLLTFLLPQNGFIAISILSIALTVAGSVEMSRMLFGKTDNSISVSFGIPLIYYLESVSASADIPADAVTVIFIAYALCSEIKAGEADEFKPSIDRMSKKLLLIIFPGFLMSFVIRFLTLPGMTSYLVLSFLLMVFSNDIFAYLCGILFGKNNRGIFKASPNKSKAGYIGGAVFSAIVSFVWFSVFRDRLPQISLHYVMILSIFISLTSDIGDLAESVIKRSAGVKDSGHIIPGRGGALDCIDSISFAAPLFYFFVRGII